MRAWYYRFLRALLRHAGYDKATLDDVALEMHISKKTIYVHYDSKREIYAHIVAAQAAREKMRLAASVATLPAYAARGRPS